MVGEEVIRSSAWKLAVIVQSTKATLKRYLSMSTANVSKSNVELDVRRWNERGHANHGWLKTFHTFSFADYQNSKFMSWGPLRVINEDRVEAGTGFPTHRHREFEIWSYVLSGNLMHKDSMGNEEGMVRGDVQYTTGGTGISHSEYAGKESTHFLQIW